jgi:Domain of unknown function (DUF4328)
VDARRDSSYVSLDSRASWAKGLLLLAGVVDLVAVLTGYAVYRLAAREEGTVTFEQFSAAEDRHGLVTMIQMGVYLVAAVVFIRWFHRAYKNLPAIGIDKLGHGTGMAIGAWFIPIVSLVWPKQIADEIWKGSDPSLTPDRTEDWSRGKVPALLGGWWLTFIASGLLVMAGTRLWENAETLSDLKLAILFEIVGDGLGVLSGVLAYVVVDRTSERQGARAKKMALWRTALPQT